MNLNICKIILENKEKFVPYIFTNIQIHIIEKYAQEKKLTKTEQTYFYTSIRKKILALESLNTEIHVTGKDMIPERLEEAKNILKTLSSNSFISGSFLYKEKYNDIDIFIISKKRKQYTKKINKHTYHFTHITEKDLSKPMIASAALYCISNFQIPKIITRKKRYGLENTVLAYQLTLSEQEEKESTKTLKDLIMEYNLLIKNKIPNSKELSEIYDKISESHDFIKKLNKMTKDILLSSYSKRYLYAEFAKLTIKTRQTIKKYPNSKTLKIKEEFFNDIKRVCRGAET